jgi:hypothetical protein
MNQPLFGFRFQLKTTTYKAYTTVATSPKSSVIKRTKKESDPEANTNSGKNLSKQNS